MKVLFVSAILPYPLLSGGQVRIYNLLKELSKHHEITLVSFIRSAGEYKYVRSLNFLKETELVMRGKRYHPKYLIRAAVGKYPLLLTSYDIKAMREKISGHLDKNRFDLIHIEPFYVYPSLPETDLPVAVGEHNVEFMVYEAYARTFSPRFLRPLLFREAKGIRTWEVTVLRKASHVTAVSDEDADVFKKLAPNTPVTIVPNGVDSSWFRYSERRFAEGRLNVLFTGNFHWLPNLEALFRLVRDIWPAVKKRYPNARLTVAGSRIPSVVLRQHPRDAEFIEKMPDIRDAFGASDVLIAPMTIGGGSKFKILESMASGVPVVTTDEGIAGLNAKEGKHFLKFDSVSEALADVTKLMGDESYRTRIIREARKLVTEMYDWPKIARLQSHVWESVV